MREREGLRLPRKAVAMMCEHTLGDGDTSIL